MLREIVGIARDAARSTWCSSPATSTTPRRRPPRPSSWSSARCSALRRAPAPRWSRSPATTTTPPRSTPTGRCAEAAGITLVGTVRTAGQRRRGRVHRPVDRRAGDGRRAAVPVPALRGAGRRAARRTRPAENTSAYDQQLRDILGSAHRGLPRRRGEPGDGPPHRAGRRGWAAASGPRSRSSSTRCPPAIFPVDAHYVALGPPAPAADAGRRRARCTTAERRWPSTSASRRTRRSSASSRPRPARRPRSPTSRSPAGRRLRTVRGTLAELSALARRWSATTSCGSWCASRPGPGCARRSRRCCRTRWRCASTRSSPRPSTAARPRRRSRAHPGRAVRASTSARRGVADPRVRGAVRRAARASARSELMRPVLLEMDGFAVVPRADHRRLHRRRLLRAGRADRRRASPR